MSGAHQVNVKSQSELDIGEPETCFSLGSQIGNPFIIENLMLHF